MDTTSKSDSALQPSFYASPDSRVKPGDTTGVFQQDFLPLGLEPAFANDSRGSFGDSERFISRPSSRVDQTAATGAEKARILIAADFPVMRLGLKEIVKADPDFVVCGEADTSRKMFEAMVELNPTVVLLDITPPGRIELIHDMVAKNSHSSILAFAIHDVFYCAERALRAGAKGYIFKNDLPARLNEAICKVVQGNIFVSDELSAYLLSKFVGKKARGIDALSNREFDVLRRIGEGTGTSEIAKALNLSIKTVETHRAHLKEKLDLQTGTQLARFATEWAIEANSESRRHNL